MQRPELRGVHDDAKKKDCRGDGSKKEGAYRPGGAAAVSVGPK